MKELIKKTIFVDKKTLPKYPNNTPNKKQLNERYVYNPKTKKIDVLPPE